MTKWIVLPIVSALCWRYGGSVSKPVRRFLMPFLSAMFAFCFPTKLHGKKKAFLIMATCIGLAMGYGHNHNWADRVLFTFLVVLPTFFLGWSIWQIIFPVVFLGGFYLSNEHGTAVAWRWHNLELFAFGPCYGCLIASVL